MFDTNVLRVLKKQQPCKILGTHFFLLDSRMASSLFGSSLRFFASEEPFEDDMALQWYRYDRSVVQHGQTAKQQQSTDRVITKQFIIDTNGCKNIPFFVILIDGTYEKI